MFSIIWKLWGLIINYTKFISKQLYIAQIILLYESNNIHSVQVIYACIPLLKFKQAFVTLVFCNVILSSFNGVVLKQSCLSILIVLTDSLRWNKSKLLQFRLYANMHAIKSNNIYVDHIFLCTSICQE